VALKGHYSYFKPFDDKRLKNNGDIALINCIKPMRRCICLNARTALLHSIHYSRAFQ